MDDERFEQEKDITFLLFLVFLVGMIIGGFTIGVVAEEQKADIRMEIVK